MKNEPRSLAALTAPVVADGVTTPTGIRSVVYVAGSSDNLNALDAATGKLIWSRTFESHVLPKDAGMWLCPNNLNATPTIDKARGLIYAIAADGKFYGLDLGTGETRIGPVQFVPAYSKDWSLNLSNDIVYTSISQGCGGARSGIYSMDIRHPNRPVIHDLLVAKSGAGIWGRGGVAIGADGRIYASTGDGEFNPAEGEYGSSLIAVASGRPGGGRLLFPTEFPAAHQVRSGHCGLQPDLVPISQQSPGGRGRKRRRALPAGCGFPGHGRPPDAALPPETRQ